MSGIERVSASAMRFDFTSQRHELAHLTVPMEVREALGLGIDGPVHLDIWTDLGHCHGDFDMTSNGEVRASRRPNGPNCGLLGVVGAEMQGVAIATRA